MNFEISYTDNFEREVRKLAKKYRSIKNDLGRLIDDLRKNPLQGTPIGKDCYKVRLAIFSKGRGKSGGARVITHVHVAGAQVYLLSVYDKSDQESISDKELLALLRYIES